MRRFKRSSRVRLRAAGCAPRRRIVAPERMIDPQRNHEARAPHAGCVAVRVRSDGRVTPVDTRAGVDLLRRLDPLARYAVAFARTQLRQARSTSIEGRACYAGCLTRARR